MAVRDGLFALSIAILFFISAGYSIQAVTQTTFVLDLNDFKFGYYENQFNDTKTYQQFDYNSSGNVTYWVKIPKNSTINDASLKVTGSIVPVYKTFVDYPPLGLSVGDINGDGNNEIVAGTNDFNGTVRIHYGNNGSLFCGAWLFGTNRVLSTDIGNITPDAGNEIVVGAEDNRVYVLEWQNTCTTFGIPPAWNYTTSGDVVSVAIRDIDGGNNEVVVGSLDGHVYMLNSGGAEKWNYSISGVNSVKIGDLASSTGNETVVGSSGGIFVLNSTGGLVWSKTDFGAEIKSVDVGDVNADSGNEIVAGGANNNVYLLNVSDTGGVIDWQFVTGNQVNSVFIGDVVDEVSGNEVVAGSEDGRIYTLTNNGSLKWDFATESQVKTVAIGNLTGNPGNEVAGGAINEFLYTFNFDLFPTNISLDIGGDGFAEWNSSYIKLRTTEKATGFYSGIQSYLNLCTPDASGNCNVPFVFNSRGPGRLNITELNITYDYRAYPEIYNRTVDEWSRTDSILVNEQVGYPSRKIYFSNTAANVDIRYVDVPDAATVCEFDGAQVAVVVVNGNTVCDVTDFAVPASGPAPSAKKLWDNTMASAVAVTLAEGIAFNTTGIDNYLWRKPFDISNTTNAQFTNVIANISLDDNIVRGIEFLNVTWSVQCELTPITEASNCDSSTPTYININCGSDIFNVCKKDRDGDGITDFFKWVQPYVNSLRSYQAGGSRNLIANLSQAAVNLSQDIWGRPFNFSVFVNDTENDDVNVTLWIYRSGSWIKNESKIVSGNGTAWFMPFSDQSWVGLDSYLFEYQDFIGPSPVHSRKNTSVVFSGPDVRRHNISIVHVQGDGYQVNRTQTVTLSVRINDTDIDAWAGSGTACTFWVTTNGVDFDSGRQNSTNSSGYCVYDFVPDGNYSVGSQKWKVGISQNNIYNDRNSSDFNLSIRGFASISLTAPAVNQPVYRSSPNTFEARLVDEFSNIITNASVDTSLFNCTWYFDSNQLANSSVGTDGMCSYPFVPGCSYNLNTYRTNVTLTGPDTQNYTIVGTNSFRDSPLYGSLDVSVDQPVSYTLYHKKDLVKLNSTTTDDCFNTPTNPYNVNWFLKWKQAFNVNLTDITGFVTRNNEPIIFNGSFLASLGINLSNWVTANTNVQRNGVAVPFEIKPWADQSKTQLNLSETRMTNYSELVFLANLSASQNAVYSVYYNETNTADYNISYIINGGFESGQTSPWACQATDCNSQYCRCEIRTKGGEIGGTKSLYLSAEAKLPNNEESAKQNLDNNITSGYVKIRYKPTGTYESGSYLRLSSESSICTLNITTNIWHETVCTVPANANDVSILVHDVGDGGSEQSASHVFIDYVCVADANGNCLTLDSGGLLSRDILSLTQIGQVNKDNTTWMVPISEILGLREVIANSSGSLYASDRDSRFILVYGWSNLSYIDVLSDFCAKVSGNVTCSQNSDVNVLCGVIDSDSLAGIKNYNVGYSNDTQFMAYRLTNSSGISSLSYKTPVQKGQYNVTCAIADQESIYYNATSSNSRVISINVASGNTTGVLLLEPQLENAAGITKNSDYTFNLTIVLNNTGLNFMFNPQIIIQTPLGISAAPASCPPVPAGSNCTAVSVISVNANANIGLNNISVNATWTNADATSGRAGNKSYVFVDSNKALNIIESNVTTSAPVGGSTNIGNFTVEAFGNDQIDGIMFSESGDNSSYIIQWIIYSPASISSLPKGSSLVVLVNVSIPLNATQGIYLANITANATGSLCSPGNCLDSILLNLTVTQPDWSRAPENITKRIGLNSQSGVIDVITINNNRDVNHRFNVSVSGSSFVTVSKSNLTVQNKSSGQVIVYHNATTALVGVYRVNITIRNIDGGIPAELNVSVALEVINLRVDILSPNRTNPVTNIDPGVLLPINVNVTFNEAPLKENMTWSIEVGGQTCNSAQSSYDNLNGYWLLNCTAPFIPGNPVNNTLKVIGNYTSIDNMIISDEEQDAVVYNDITPPSFSAIEVQSVDWNSNVAAIAIKVNITDNAAVDSSWGTVKQPDNVIASLPAPSKSGNTYTFSFSNPNIIGDYDITIYANDSKGQANSTSGFFEVYLPIQFVGSSKNPKDGDQKIVFTFFRPGTSTVIHQFETDPASNYNHTVRKRIYDIKVNLSDQIIVFKGADINTSAVNQHGITNPRNLTNPFRADFLPNSTSEDISNILLPNTAEKVLTSIAIETPNLTFTSASVTVNYARALQTGTYQEGRFEIMRCTSWNFDSRTCASAFDYLDRSLNPNISSDTFAFSTTSFSAFAIAEDCSPNICGAAPIPPEPPAPSPGGGGGPPPSQPVCGNNRCEIGENDQNCPTDCLQSKFPFSVKTTLGDIRVRPGENKTYTISVTNEINRRINVLLSVTGDAEKFLTFQEKSFDIDVKNTHTRDAYVSIPKGTEPATYTSVLTVSSEGKSQEIPVTVRVSLEGESLLSLLLNLITKEVNPDGNLRFGLEVRNIGYTKDLNVTLVYIIKDGQTEEVIKTFNETVLLEKQSQTFTKTLSLSGADIKIGDYILDVWADFEDGSVNTLDGFSVVESFWDTTAGRLLIIFTIGAALFGGSFFGYRRYKRYVKLKARYVFPLNYSKLPQETDEAFWIGRIAETDKKAWFNPNDLMTHVLVAGATGSGKSVSASVFVEEALDRKIPTIVFDPTAQWTGFVNPCKDENLVRYYPKFGMQKENSRPYKGMIFEVTDPRVKIGFQKFMNPGEITVFTLNKLQPGEYDIAVQTIIDSIFKITWEESTELKMIIVFDEVHRLLEKYGGKGGYVSLEKAAREFRKWGIGLIMCSQVLADFKEAIAGNVLTEVQLNTKSITDIEKVKQKYGDEYAQKISRQAVGVGLVQNPKYNEGKPYFINFRPTWHNPHKITNEEMELYKQFAASLEVIEKKIADMKKKGQDTFDIELELRLAKDKLKLGRFRMAKIYISSLQQHLGIEEKKKKD